MVPKSIEATASGWSIRPVASSAIDLQAGQGAQAHAEIDDHEDRDDDRQARALVMVSLAVLRERCRAQRRD